MFETTIAAAIDAARTLAGMDELSRVIWQGHGSGALGEAEAQALAERLHERRGAIRAAIVPVGIPVGRPSLFPPRRYQSSPDRAASRDRRRELAASGPMPPALAARFTTGQLAVLRIVGDEISEKGVCALCIDAIAARAGVCRRLAQGALRLAEGDGLIVIEERRHQGRKNDPNAIRMLSREWRAWINRRRRAARSRHRVQNAAPHGYQGSKSVPSRQMTTSEGLTGSRGWHQRTGLSNVIREAGANDSTCRREQSEPIQI